MPYLTRFNADTSKPANASSAGTKPPETLLFRRPTRSRPILRSLKIVECRFVAGERRFIRAFLCIVDFIPGRVAFFTRLNKLFACK